MDDLDFEAGFGLVNDYHVHPCETCGNLVDCFDECDEGIQTVVYCRECERGAIAGVSEQSDRGEVTRQLGSAERNDATQNGK